MHLLQKSCREPHRRRHPLVDQHPHAGRGHGQESLADRALAFCFHSLGRPTGFSCWVRINHNMVTFDISIEFLQVRDHSVLHCQRHPVRYPDFVHRVCDRPTRRLLHLGHLERVQENQGGAQRTDSFHTLIKVILTAYISTNLLIDYDYVLLNNFMQPTA